MLTSKRFHSFRPRFAKLLADVIGVFISGIHHVVHNGLDGPAIRVGSVRVGYFDKARLRDGAQDSLKFSGSPFVLVEQGR